MSTYGRRVLSSTGHVVQVAADMQDFRPKVGGITLAWALFAAAGAPVTLPGDLKIKAGVKYCRLGQIVCEVTANGATKGKYGPYDPAANDGRQLLTRGKCYIINKSVLELGLIPEISSAPTDHPVAFDNGTVWREMLLITTGAHSLAAGPTIAEFEAAFPRISYVQ